MMTVSLCVVAYNEENFLPSLLLDLQEQTYPHELTEIVLIDSMSSDKTKEIMKRFSDEESSFYSIQVLDNPKKIQAAGWNVAIANAKSDVIIRIDAHTHIPSDFTEKNMVLQESGEFVTGGIRPCLIDNPTPWKKTLLEVENSLFGSSFNKCRRNSEKTYVKTMFHAAYKKEVFANVGGFNENLLRTEDNEMHHRIREAGYKLSYDPNIVSYQYARGSLGKMIKQKYGNGKWIGLTLGVCPRCVSVFHLVPLAFIMGIIATTTLGIFGWWLFATLMWCLYGFFAITNTLISIFQDGFTITKLMMPFLFFILHLAYGIGTLNGLIQMPFKRKKLKYCAEIENVKKVLNNVL